MNRKDIDIRKYMPAVEQKKTKEEIVFDEELIEMEDDTSKWVTACHKPRSFDHVLFIGYEDYFYFYLCFDDDDHYCWIFRQKRVL